MKPVLEHLPKEALESFVVKDFDYNYYPTPWHFHPEYEIVLVTESTGKRFIGDNIANFVPGDLALIGPNLPHLYRNDAVYYGESSELHAKSIVVHFSAATFGAGFLQLPEAKQIATLLVKSKTGLHITGKANKAVSEKLHGLITLSGFPRLLKLLEILQVLSETNEYRGISGGAVKGINDKESNRMNEVLNFIINNFSNDISLGDAAAVANMAQNSFSRYFRQRTRKTFTRYINELRLNHAAKLLIERDKTVVDICYECGFNNLSNFNRYFRLLYHANPLTYRKQFWNKVNEI